MSTYRIIAEIKPAGQLVLALMLDGVPTGFRARLYNLPVTPAEKLVEIRATFAAIQATTVNLLPGADASASQAAATANQWAYDAALTAAEEQAIEAARELT